MSRGVCGALLLALLATTTADAYPIARERELGERFSIEAASALPLLREPEVVGYVSHVGRQIVAHLDAPQPFDYRFAVVRDGQLNAFAAPGGFVYVNSGLIARVANDSELAGVLGHEIGHAHARHIVRQQEKTRLVSYAALAGMLLSMVQPAIGAAAMGANATAQLKYAREFEQEADYLGMRYMREAGYDPHGMASFMKKIWQEQLGGPATVPPYMLSHPLTEERIVNLEAATKNMPAVPAADVASWRLQRVQAIVEAETGERGWTRSAGPASSGGKSHALLGLARLYRGDPAGGRAELEKAKTMGAPDLDGEIGLARLRQGDVEGALTVLRGRVEAAPDDAVAHASLGEALLQHGDFAAAEAELARAIALVPELDVAEYDLGQSYGKAGDAGRGLYHLARASQMRGEIDLAIAHYTKAEKLLAAGSAEAEEAKRQREALEEIRTRPLLGR